MEVALLIRHGQTAGVVSIVTGRGLLCFVAVGAAVGGQQHFGQLPPSRSCAQLLNNAWSCSWSDRKVQIFEPRAEEAEQCCCPGAELM